MLSIHLRDITPAIATAWETDLADAPEVEVSCGDIFGATADAIVSPANSFGYITHGEATSDHCNDPPSTADHQGRATRWNAGVPRQ